MSRRLDKDLIEEKSANEEKLSTEHSRVQNIKNGLKSFVQNDIVQGVAFLLLFCSIVLGGYFVLAPFSSDVTTNVYTEIAEQVTSYQSKDVRPGAIITLSNKYRRSFLAGKAILSNYYFELAIVNIDGVTTTHQMRVSSSIYNQAEIGDKFLYNEYGRIQPLDNEG